MTQVKENIAEKKKHSYWNVHKWSVHDQWELRYCHGDLPILSTEITVSPQNWHMPEPGVEIKQNVG